MLRCVLLRVFHVQPLTPVRGPVGATGGTEGNTGVATRGATTEEGGGVAPRLDTFTHPMMHMEVHTCPYLAMYINYGCWHA